MPSSNTVQRLALYLLFLLLIMERLYGIWFLRWAFDEEQNFGGGTAILKWGLNLLGMDVPNPEMEHLVSIYGIVGKYLAIVPAALGFGLEDVVGVDLPIPLGLIFTRVVVSFLPNVLTVYLVYLMAWQIGGNRVMQWSVLVLFLFTFKHIETAHYGVSDALATFFVVWSMYLLGQFCRAVGGKERRKYLIWMALACVLAISTKINVGVVISGVVLGSLVFYGGRWTVNGERRGEERERDWRSILIFVSAWGVFFVGVNLPYLWHWEEWYGELIRHLREYPYTIRGSWWTLFCFHPPFGVGWGILGMALGGVTVYGLRWTENGERETVEGSTLFTYKRERLDWVLLPALCFLVLFYGYLAFSRGVIHRWAIPMTPFLVLFGAYFLGALYDWSGKLLEGKWRKWVVVLGAIGVIGGGLNSFGHVWQFNFSLTAQETTYQLLEEFVEREGLEGNCIYNLEGMVLKDCSEQAPESVKALEGSGIEYVIFSDFWFSERRYPVEILYLEVIDERMHGNWRVIRDYLEGEKNGWHLIQYIEPKYYTHWSTNIAQPPVFYVYRRMTDGM